MVLLFTLVYLSFENPVTKHILLGITPLVIWKKKTTNKNPTNQTDTSLFSFPSQEKKGRKKILSLMENRETKANRNRFQKQWIRREQGEGGDQLDSALPLLPTEECRQEEYVLAGN